MKPFYITTAIHYVNDLPHIGHMYENVVADVIARHRRRMGDDVWFLTGTDEHGQKIERSAARDGISPLELADRVVAHHRELWKKLNISYDDFIRTTEARHRLGVYELIRRIQERTPDDIYLGEHTGWYCSNEETFVPDSQVVDGRDEANHPVEKTTERNYFFRLSRYGPILLDFYRAHPTFVRPATRFNEVISFVQSGLKDLSVSRTAISWGIPFPGNPDHVVYVWMDALTNYISALGFGSSDHSRFDRYWPADIQLIGKDIIRFHAVYWPAFLLAAGLQPPKSVVGHGWWLRDNQKISKSTGNVVRPTNIIDQFGADPFRYFVLRDMTFGQDSNYSDESFLSRYNSDLANDLGNTLSRAIKMSDSYFGGRTPPTPCQANDLKRTAEEVIPEYLASMEQLAFQRALDSVWKLLNQVNGYIVGHEPWKRFKESGASEVLSQILWNTLEALRLVFVMTAPFMPDKSRAALERLGADPGAIEAAALAWGGLPNGAPVRVTDPLFPRIDAAEYVAAITTEARSLMNDKPVEEKAAPAAGAEASGSPDPARTEASVPHKTEASVPHQAGVSGSDEAATPVPAHSGPPAETTQAMPPDAARVSIDQFFEIDLRVAEVRAAENVPKSRKLIKLTLWTGDAERTVVAGIAATYKPEDLIGRKVVIVANLHPARLMGIESNGMVLAASINGEASLLAVDPSVPAGTKVK